MNVFMKNQLPYYLQLMRVEKPIGWMLLMWPTLCALWLAGDGSPDPVYVWVFVIEVFIMRSAGCVINDYADRNIDGEVERTKQRPLAAGNLSSNQALGLFIILGLLATLTMLLFLPSRVWGWAIPSAAVTIAYPFMKRFIKAPQLVLGVAFSFSIPMAYVVLEHDFDISFWLLVVANFLWVLVYDTEYAMSDREDDLKIGVNSTAILFGVWDKFIIGILQMAIIVLWLFLMSLQELSNAFVIPVILVMLSFAYQQWLIFKRERIPCFNAFLNNAWVGAYLWFGLIVSF